MHLVMFGTEKSILRALLYGAAVFAAASANGSAIYEVDEDRDGRADRLLILEQSDSLA